MLLKIHPSPQTPSLSLGDQGERRHRNTYHTTSEREEYRQRIQRDHHHTAQRTDEPPRQSNEADDEEPDSEEDFIIRDGRGATVGLRCNQVTTETEDDDCEEDLSE